MSTNGGGGEAVEVDSPIRLTLGWKHLVVNQSKVHPFQSSGFRWVNLHPYVVDGRPRTADPAKATADDSGRAPAASSTLD